MSEEIPVRWKVNKECLESHPHSDSSQKYSLKVFLLYSPSQVDNLSMNYFVVFSQSHSSFIHLSLGYIDKSPITCLLYNAEIYWARKKQTIKVIKKCRAKIRLFFLVCFLRIFKAPKPKRIENVEKRIHKINNSLFFIQKIK